MPVFTTALWLLFIMLLGLISLNSMVREFDQDEFETIHTAWKILQGRTIYIDFFQHHHPLFYALLTPIIATFGESTNSVMVARLVAFAMLGGILILTYRLATELYDARTALVSLLFLSSALIFVEKAIEIRPDVPQALFGLLALVLLFRFVRSRSTEALILSACALAVSFLFLQKGIALIGLIGLWVGFRWARGDVTGRDLLLYATAFGLTLVPFILYLVYQDAVGPYWTLNWLVNLPHSTLNWLVDLPRGDGSVDLVNLPPGGGSVDLGRLLSVLKQSYMHNSLLWGFYIVGLLWLRKTPPQWEIAAFSVGLLLYAVTATGGLRQYYMQAMPLVAIVAGHGLVRLIRGGEGERFVLILLAILLPAGFLASKPWRFGNDEQLAKINYVLSLTTPQDRVYDGDIQFNLFREDLDFFWYSVASKNSPHAVDGKLLTRYRMLQPYSYDIYDRIETLQPKVISDHEIDIGDPAIAEFYVRSTVFDDLLLRRE